MKLTRSFGLFMTLCFLVGQLSLHSTLYRVASSSSETKTEIELQPLMEFKYSLAKLLDLVEENKPRAFKVVLGINQTTFRVHLALTLLNSHHISLPPPSLS